MARDPGTGISILQSKHKAIGTIFPYAIRLEQVGQKRMLDAISHASRASGLTLQRKYIGTRITALFDESSPPSLNRAIVLTSPYVSMLSSLYTKRGVARWVAAAAAVPYSEEVGQSVVDTLLHISNHGILQPCVPVEMWAWLKKRPPLPPLCRGRSNGSWLYVVRLIRGLGDIEIFKSYLLLTWSEWNTLSDGSFAEMQVSIGEEFGGIGRWCHRDDLIKHLDHVLGQLDRGLEYFESYKPWANETDIQKSKVQYAHLQDVLLEVDERAMENLTRTPPRTILLDRCTNPCERVQDPTRPSPVLFPFRAHDSVFETAGITSPGSLISTWYPALHCNLFIHISYFPAPFRTFQTATRTYLAHQEQPPQR